MIHHLWTALQTGVSLRAKEPAGPATTQYGTETQFVSEAQRTRSDESRLTAHVSGPQMTGKARCSKKIGRKSEEIQGNAHLYNISCGRWG